MNDFGEKVLPKKCAVEIREVDITTTKPYLILTITEGSSIKAVSTTEVDFFKTYKMVSAKLRKGNCECSVETRKLLKLGIDEIYRRYSYPEDVYTDGKVTYFYDKLCKLREYATKFQDVFLYSCKDKNGWIHNLGSIGCNVYETADDRFYASIEMNKDFNKLQLSLQEKLSLAKKKYYGLNAFFSAYLNVYATEKKNRTLTWIDLENNSFSKENAEKFPYIQVIDKETIGILTDSFEEKIEMLTRALVLPYDDFVKDMESINELGDFERLDYLCGKYVYPRGEIKKRIAECTFLQEMEDKDKVAEKVLKTEKKGLLKRLFGF